jgi:sulfoxide reductase heme-binding subunit YedZ
MSIQQNTKTRASKRSPLRIAPSWVLLSRLLIHGISALWLAYIYYAAIEGNLPGDPVQYLLNFSGIGAIHLIMLSLLISPLAQYFKFAQLIRIRKTLDVYAAVYAIFHVYVFVAYELKYEWLLILEEIIKRPYITVGMLAFLILSSLLVTSLQSIKKAMASKWQKLHNFIYPALILGCIHYLWSVKSDWYEPTVYLILALGLLFLRKNKIKKIFK